MIPTPTSDASRTPCPRCDSFLGAGAPFVLVPAADVPRSGSRTEILVTPSACLHVVARVCERGHVTLDQLPST